MLCYAHAHDPIRGMPKKTKKEKLLAQKHRQSVQAAPVVIHHEPAPPLPTSNATFSLSALLGKPQPNSVLLNDFAVIKKDLVKTVLLIIGILLSEFVLAKVL